ncbi:thioredoxin, mitochondrial [Nilaparvata lugens]|uniref:thioredoxin, mitochondrial n=1 Tax=Nilaparvata lugens TaxID=108931 RepID=UPI000B9829E6|nr:thioredoxin, mitochondrial [Nilaparvata lugens]XP_039294451.1 thioredoxin, mitochondrial [Nilaparvata lugens]
MLAVCRRLASRRSIHLAGATQKSFTINDNDHFVQNVMNSSVPVIVNFHAEWCEPCHILTPKLNELIETRDDINLATVDVEKCAELVHTFEVKAVPAVIAIRNGLVIDKFIGLVDGDMIDSLINKLCPAKAKSDSQT